MKKSLIVMAALFIMSSLFVVSCGGGSSSSTATTDGPTIGVTIYRYDDNFMSFYRRNIETRISGKANLIINDSQNNQAQQNDQVDVMIQKDSKALAINLVDPQAAQTIIDTKNTMSYPSFP